MLFVFGLFIINVVWDLMVGYLLSGLLKGVEVFLMVFVIGVGIVIVFIFL